MAPRRQQDRGNRDMGRGQAEPRAQSAAWPQGRPFGFRIPGRRQDA